MNGAGAPPATPAEVGDAVARARASYDRTPYESLPYPRQQPARISAAALWAGVAAPDAATARVLEIGCASGGHLIPLAAAWPRARFLGVDISPVQIAAGRERIARAGLANIALDGRSLHEIGPKDGAFDYIICHGLLSWVAEPLREALMRVVAERLAPNGVAMLSFNVLPGWRLIQVARDSLLLHARLEAERGRPLDGRALVEALSAQSNSRYSYGRIWRDEAQQVFRGGDAYVAHEFYEDVNEPLAFLDFCEALDRHALAYLGECDVSTNFVRAMAPAAADTIAALAAGDDRAREQYIDIFSGRAFRESLVVRRDRADAGLGKQGVALDSLHFVADSGLAVTPVADRGGPWKICEGEDGGVTVADEAVADAVGRLIAGAPRSSTLEDVAPVAATEPERRKRIAAGLIELVISGFCAISTEPIVCATRLPERPRAWPLAASDARAGAATANLRHEPVAVEPLQRLTLPLLDGTRTRADLAAHALGLIDAGELTISGPDGPVADRARLIEGLGQATDSCLADLLRLALIEGE